MKTLATAAKAAIVAGEAIVSGAVEITPLGAVNYTTVDTVDLSATANAAHNASDAISLALGVTLSGFDPSDIVRVSLPPGQTYVAYSVWGVPSPANEPGHTGSQHWFNVIPDGVAGSMFYVGDLLTYDGYAAARAAFGSTTFTGASAYTFYIQDNPISDNAGGLSILVERGVAVGTADPLRLWGGYGPLAIAGNDFAGVGDHAMAQQTAGAIGGVAQGMTLGLSGIETEVLALLDDAPQFRGAAVVIYRLIFAADGKTLLDAHVFDRGRLDTIDSDAVVGGEATISAAVESTARSLGRSLARLRSDSDQRLILLSDGYFDQTAYAWQKELYWGGKKPSRTASAVGGTSSAGTGSALGAGAASA
jgi:hypothetical protein